MMQLSKTEQRIFEVMQAKPERRWSIDDLASAVYGRSNRPKNWRLSLSAIMRTLQMKTGSRLVRIVRTSQRGRGNHAAYMLDTYRLKEFLAQAKPK